MPKIPDYAECRNKANYARFDFAGNGGFTSRTTATAATTATAIIIQPEA